MASGACCNSAVSTGRIYAGESAADRDARRRRQLLDAALHIFGERGYAQATVRGICREAHVADRNFYEYFPTTEDLLIAVYDECCDRLETAATEAVLAARKGEHPGAVPVARAGLDAFLTVVRENPALGRVVWQEVLGVSPRVDATYQEREERFAAMLLALAPVLEDARVAAPPAQRRLADADLRHRLIALTGVGGVNQVVLRWVVGGFSEPQEAIVGVLVDHLTGTAAILART